MESQNQRWVNSSFVLLSVLLAFLMSTLLAKVSGVWDLEARFKQTDLAIRALSIGSGVLLFLILYNWNKANQFVHEVIAELSRVTWPLQKETTNSTFIVIVMVAICGVILGLFDWICVKLIQFIL